MPWPPLIRRSKHRYGPRGDPSLAYFRLHGSPTMYYSAYSDEMLSNVAESMTEPQRSGAVVWCIFDNTAAGAAQLNTVQMQRLLTRNVVKQKPQPC